MISTALRRPTKALIIVLGALSAFGPLSMDMYLPGLPSLTRELGASASTGQLTLTACMLGIALGQLVAGPLSDSTGRRRPLLAGLAGFVAASLACAAAPSVWALIVLRFVQGLAGGTGVVIARAVVRDLYDGSAAARIFAVQMLIMGVAPVFAPLLGGQVLIVSSWRGIFVVLAIVGVGLLASALLAVPETLPAEERHGGGLVGTATTFGRLLRDRRFMPHATAFALACGTLFAYIAGSSFVLENVYGSSPQLFSVMFALNAAGLVTMAQVGRHFVGRLGAAQLLRLGLLGTAVGSAATLLSALTGAGLALLLPALFVLISANGLVAPNGTAAALSEQSGALGSASALLGLGQFGVGAIVAPLVGLAGPYDALPMGVVIAACGLGALAVAVLLAPHGRRR